MLYRPREGGNCVFGGKNATGQRNNLTTKKKTLFETGKLKNKNTIVENDRLKIDMMECERNM